VDKINSKGRGVGIIVRNGEFLSIDNNREELITEKKNSIAILNIVRKSKGEGIKAE
jgi:hypothetical protein